MIRTVIERGHFEKFVKKELSARNPFDDADVRYDVKIPSDVDPVNKQKRINKYEKKRQFLLRAAVVKAARMNSADTELFLPPLLENQYRIRFDLSKRHDREYIPTSVEKILSVSMNAKKRGATHIPHFLDF